MKKQGNKKQLFARRSKATPKKQRKPRKERPKLKKFLRGERKFSSLEELKKAIENDVSGL